MQSSEKPPGISMSSVAQNKKGQGSTSVLRVRDGMCSCHSHGRNEVFIILLGCVPFCSVAHFKPSSTSWYLRLGGQFSSPPRLQSPVGFDVTVR